MAVPTAPNRNLIVLEGVKKGGYPELFGRARDEFLEEIKNDIWLRAGLAGNTRLKSLQSENVQISKPGISKYDFPDDFDEEIGITILEGTSARPCQDSTSTTTIKLSSCESGSTGDLSGKYILLTDSTSTGTPKLHAVLTYSTSTYIATFETSYSTQPITSDDYSIINQEIDLEEDNVMEMGGLGGSFDVGKPTKFMKILEDGEQRFIFDKPCDSTPYGILIRYYVDLALVDLTATIMTNIYRTWRSPLVTGIAYKTANTMQDWDNSKILKAEYEKLVSNLLIKEQPFGGEWQGFEL